MDERLLECSLLLGEAADEPSDLAAQPPRMRQPEVVVMLASKRRTSRSVRSTIWPLCSSGSSLEQDELPRDLGAPRPQLVLVLPGELERLLEQRVRLCKLSEPDEHAADVRQRLRLVCTARREVRSPLEEVQRRRQVAAEKRTLARRRRAGRGARCSSTAATSLTGPSCVRNMNACSRW